MNDGVVDQTPCPAVDDGDQNGEVFVDEELRRWEEGDIGSWVGEYTAGRAGGGEFVGLADKEFDTGEDRC